MDIVTYAAAVKKTKQLETVLQTQIDETNIHVAEAWDMLQQLVALFDVVVFVKGTYSGNTGTADKTYRQIFRAVTGDEPSLGDFVLGYDELAGFGETKNVILALRPEDSTGIYDNNIKLGTLFGLDNENQRAVFAIGKDTAYVDGDGNIVISRGEE